MLPRALIVTTVLSLAIGTVDGLVSASRVVAGQAADVLEQARAALGGDKLTAVRTLSLEGPFTRAMGPQQIEGTTLLALALPDRMHRSEETAFPGGASIERVTAIAGDVAWDDVQNRGGMGGGMQIMTFRGPGGQPMSEEAMAEARSRRMQAERRRWLLALLLHSDETPAHAGVAESGDGKADVLELRDERGQAVRLFLDQQTHLPLMLAYQDVRPRMMFGGPGGGRGPGGRGSSAGGPPPDREAMRRRLEAEGPPPPSAISMYLADYRSVDGVMLPHRITQSVDGQPSDEWTIEKVKVNPSLKAELFEKKLK